MASEAPETASGSRDVKIGFFGARKVARSLAQEVEQLRADLDRLGVLDVVDLERRRDELTAEVEILTARSAEELAAHQRRLADESERAGNVQQRKVDTLVRKLEELEGRHRDLERQIVQTEDLAILQEAGIYSYRHRLGDSVAHQAELKRIQDQAKAMTRRDGGAVSATTNWQVNGSAAKGRTMVNDISKLMLRAYNAEADDLARTMKPYKLDSSVDRLEKVVSTIERLGRSMSIRISPGYHRLRVQELELTADFIEMQAEEKAREREEKERLREERKAQQELDRERDRLQKEKQHYANALAVLEAKGDVEGAARLREQVEDLERAIEDVDYRAANVRAGYVYVISNIGAFGDSMVKVGMTRRLEPMDRIKELSDASVPFNFDVHALFFSNDAVGIEAAMHSRLAEQRVNKVNLRREFFHATPAQAKAHLAELSGDLLTFEEVAEAVEYRQSITA